MPGRARIAVCLALLCGSAAAAGPAATPPPAAAAAQEPCAPDPCSAEICPVQPADPTVALSGRPYLQDAFPAAPAPSAAPEAMGGPGSRKRAWEESWGGRDAAKAHLKARLAGWPSRWLADRRELPAADREFLWRVARDTWRGIAAFTDRENGLPLDHVRFRSGSLAVADTQIGDYVSPSALGLYLVAVSAAVELRLATREEALGRLRRALATLRGLERWRGMLYNFYDTTSLEPTSHFVSFVDSAWLTAGLMVVRTSFPELAADATAMIEERDYGFFYDPVFRQMSHGYFVDRGEPSPYHYATLYTEARIGSLIAIGKGDVPEDHWFRMVRTFPPTCTWQSLPPQSRKRKEVRGYPVTGGFYEWKGLRYVPSWGGSMFEALMPTLLVDEKALAPHSLGRNAAVHVEVQRRYATEELGLPVWGMSPAADPGPDGYREYGVPVLGTRGYPDAAVTPHAVALALAIEPKEAVANLRRLATSYDLYGDFGFFDSVDPRTGSVGTAYLVLDQSMLFIALANHLDDGVMQKRFAADPIAARALSILSDEDFLD